MDMKYAEDYSNKQRRIALREFVEHEENWQLVHDWLFNPGDPKGEEALIDMLEAYADSNKGGAFYEWLNELINGETAEHDQ